MHFIHVLTSQKRPDSSLRRQLRRTRWTEVRDSPRISLSFLIPLADCRCIRKPNSNINNQIHSMKGISDTNTRGKKYNISICILILVIDTERQELPEHVPFFCLPMMMMKCGHIVGWQFLLNTIEEWPSQCLSSLPKVPHIRYWYPYHHQICTKIRLEKNRRMINHSSQIIEWYKPCEYFA